MSTLTVHFKQYYLAAISLLADHFPREFPALLLQRLVLLGFGHRLRSLPLRKVRDTVASAHKTPGVGRPVSITRTTCTCSVFTGVGSSVLVVSRTSCTGASRPNRSPKCLHAHRAFYRAESLVMVCTYRWHAGQAQAQGGLRHRCAVCIPEWCP